MISVISCFRHYHTGEQSPCHQAKREYKHEDRGKFFSNRVVKEYNDLPDNVKQATTINSFKNALDKFRGTPTRGSSPTGI